jgi:serine/threonine protein kinase
VTTKTPCDVFCLAMEAFLEVIKDHPQVRDAMEKEVYRRFEEAKYDLSQRKDPQIRQLISQAVEREYAMMKAKRSQKIKWQLNKKIGSGAAGSVYSAIDLSTGRPIAVKVLNIAGAKSTLLLSIQQESELMLRLRHPNLVEGYGMEKDDDGNQLYILMELLPMGSIQKVLKEFGPLSEQATRLYARQMLSGLHYLHKHGVLHRDIKPGNMLISAQGVVKLTDFGIARYGTFLDTATISGTPAYLSPDAICGKYSIASDIWAMGCSILEMVTRQVPWSELNFEASTQLLFHVGSGKVTPQLPSVAASPTDYEQAGAISPQLHSLLSRMLSLDPALRGDCATILQHEFFTCPEEQLPWQPNRLQRVIQRGTIGDVDSLQSLTETADDSQRRTYPG